MGSLLRRRKDTRKTSDASTFVLPDARATSFGGSEKISADVVVNGCRTTRHTLEYQTRASEDARDGIQRNELYYHSMGGSG